jgi:hypothetical protein
MNGSIVDREIESEFGIHELDLVKDVIGIINLVTHGKEDWFVRVENVRGEDESVIPMMTLSRD